MMQLYALDTSDSADSFSHTLASSLDVSLAAHEERHFEDGERKLRPLSDPRGNDAYVVASLHGDTRLSPHDRLCRLLMFIATLREHGAARVTAVVPYLAYARKDRQTKAFDPLSSRYVAQLFEAVGTAQIMALEVHNVAAFQNAFRCTSLHLEVHRIFDKLVTELAGEGPLAVASPDPGGVKRAQLWRESLEHRLQQTIGFAMLDKRRSTGIVSSENLVAGNVRQMSVLLLDDLIASGDTMKRAANALLTSGASQVIACAAHGLFTGAANELLSDDCIAKVAVTDSVAPFRLPADASLRKKLHVVSAAPLFALAIRASHHAWLR
jgi:ribose-phosphate pyrophosphokinase